jgi:hypothetical protein
VLQDHPTTLDMRIINNNEKIVSDESKINREKYDNGLVRSMIETATPRFPILPKPDFFAIDCSNNSSTVSWIDIERFWIIIRTRSTAS